MNQEQRVLRLLRHRGQRGVCQHDFDPPHVVDGGPPIRRVAARIDDLKKHGAVITTDGRRHRFVVYVLVSATNLSDARSTEAPSADEARTEDAHEGAALFDATPPPINAATGDWEAA